MSEVNDFSSAVIAVLVVLLLVVVLGPNQMLSDCEREHATPCHWQAVPMETTDDR